MARAIPGDGIHGVGEEEDSLHGGIAVEGVKGVDEGRV